MMRSLQGTPAEIDLLLEELKMSSTPSRTRLSTFSKARRGCALGLSRDPEVVKRQIAEGQASPMGESGTRRG